MRTRFQGMTVAGFKEHYTKCPFRQSQYPALENLEMELEMDGSSFPNSQRSTGTAMRYYIVCYCHGENGMQYHSNWGHRQMVTSMKCL